MWYVRSAPREPQLFSLSGVVCGREDREAVQPPQTKGSTVTRLCCPSCRLRFPPAGVAVPDRLSRLQSAASVDRRPRVDRRLAAVQAERSAGLVSRGDRRLRRCAARAVSSSSTRSGVRAADGSSSDERVCTPRTGSYRRSASHVRSLRIEAELGFFSVRFSRESRQHDHESAEGPGPQRSARWRGGHPPARA